MAKAKISDEEFEEEVLSIITAAIGLVLASKSGGRTDVLRDRECAVNVLASLEDDGFRIVKDAHRT